MPSIHQLLPVLSPGDAIGQAVRRLRTAFRAAGFTSETFAELVHPGLRGEAHPAEELEARVAADDVVLYHLSLGARCARLFAELPCRRVIVYHNITPPHFYAAISPKVTYWLEQGRRDLERLAPGVELGVGDFEYNAAELRAAGCPTTMVIPPPVDLDRLSPDRRSPATHRSSSSSPVWRRTSGRRSSSARWPPCAPASSPPRVSFCRADGGTRRPTSPDFAGSPPTLGSRTRWRSRGA